MISKGLLWTLATVLVATVALSAGQSENSSDTKDLEGKKILETACTTCHDLKEVEKFKGFFKREDWQDVVTTMVKYGAEVKEAQVPVLVDYLTKTYTSK